MENRKKITYDEYVAYVENLSYKQFHMFIIAQHLRDWSNDLYEIDAGFDYAECCEKEIQISRLLAELSIMTEILTDKYEELHDLLVNKLVP